MPTFQPPFQHSLTPVLPSTRGPEAGLWRHGRLRPEGVTLYKKDGVWYERLVPANSELLDAEHVFLGGHIYVISDELAAELEDEGWDVGEHGPFPSDFRFPSTRDFPGEV